MEVLDNVYKTFTNLERDFGRSKKSRSEFIQGKFGGNIAIGSMIILDAISAGADIASPEDIEKMSFVKDIFESIKSNEDKLDQLTSFSVLGGGDPMEDLLGLLRAADTAGSAQTEVTQADLHRKDKGTVHFISTVAGTQYADLNKCKILHNYNSHMEGMLTRSVSFVEPAERGAYYNLRSHGKAMRIKFSEISSNLK